MEKKKWKRKKKNQVHSCVRFPPSAWIHEQWPWLIGSFPSIRLGGADATSAKMKRHCFTGRRGSSGTKEAERYLLMACYSSRGPGGGWGGTRGAAVTSASFPLRPCLSDRYSKVPCNYTFRIHSHAKWAPKHSHRTRKKKFTFPTHFSLLSLLLFATSSFNLRVSVPLM